MSNIKKMILILIGLVVVTMILHEDTDFTSKGLKDFLVFFSILVANYYICIKK